MKLSTKNILKSALFCILYFYTFASAAAISLDDKTVDLLKPKLNSSRISYFFGSYGIEQLECCSTIFPHSRISNLYSLHDNTKIMRTLAIIDFMPVNPELQVVHKQILGGTSIGIALREAGYDLIKSPIYFGSIPLSIAVLKWMQEEKEQTGAIHIYMLEVKKSGKDKVIPYCTIIEIHSPLYLTPSWLKALYNKEYPDFHYATPIVQVLLAQTKKCLDDFPIP